MELNEEMFLTNYGCVCPKYKKGLPVCRSSAMCPTASAEWNAIRVASAQAQAANGLVNAMHDGVTEVRTNLIDVVKAIGRASEVMDQGFGELQSRMGSLAASLDGVAPAIEELETALTERIEWVAESIDAAVRSVVGDLQEKASAGVDVSSSRKGAPNVPQKVEVKVDAPETKTPMTFDEIGQYYRDLSDPKKAGYWINLAIQLEKIADNLRADMLGQIPGVAGVRVVGEIERLHRIVAEMYKSSKSCEVTQHDVDVVRDKLVRDTFAKQLEEAADFLEATREKPSPESLRHLGYIRSIATYLKLMRDATEYEAARLDIAHLISQVEWAGDAPCGSCGGVMSRGHVEWCGWKKLADRLGIASSASRT